MTPVSAMQTLNQLLRKKIDARKQDNAYRALAPSPAPLKDFCSNDYLGLARSPDLYDLIIKNGTVIDPAQNLYAPREVAVQGGKIAALLEPGTLAPATETVKDKFILRSGRQWNGASY